MIDFYQLTLSGNSFVLNRHLKRLQDRDNSKSNHRPEQFRSQH